MPTNPRKTPKPPRGSRVRMRRGMSLMIVMIAISTSLVLTCAFLRTQANVLQIGRNNERRDRALEAAETGAAVALERLQSPAWGGVDEHLSRVLSTTSEGRTEYSVRFEPYAAGTSSTAVEDALALVVRATGIWQSAVNAADRVERRVEVVVRLRPRAPDRSVGPGDSASAEDIAANPPDYDQIQTYSLFAAGSGDSLTLDPGDRIEGRVWVYDELRLYKDPSWSSGIRRDLLDSVGTSLVSESGGSLTYQNPHPLAGDVQFYRNPSNSTRDDLQRIRTPWSRASSQPTLASIDGSNWHRYRLYSKGFEYQAVELGSTLRNATLRPTADNPLGIFYRSGNLRLDDNVTVQGTLVVTGNLQIDGDLIQLAGFNWRNDEGNPVTSGAEHWPRLPAIVAHSVGIDRECRVSVQGAVIAQSTFAGAGGNYELLNVPNVSLTGTATARRLEQPLSRVQLGETPNLQSLNSRGD